MKVLYLGELTNTIEQHFINNNIHFAQTTENINGDFKQVYNDCELVISYGYRYLLDKDTIIFFKNRIINLHISLLPWNRGADPNLWSFLEDTPKGVSIHYIDEGLDTGEIILQKKINFDDTEHTLASTYAILKNKLEELLIDNWNNIVFNRIKSRPQLKSGTYHRSKDKNPYLPLLTEGWNTKVSKITGVALKNEN